MTATTFAPTTAAHTTQQLAVEDLAALVSDLADNPSAWQDKIRFKRDQRWWTRLDGDDVADVWLLTWVTDTNTDLHDHGDSSGAFIVVAGALEEIRPAVYSDNLIATTLRVGDVRTVDRGTVHDVCNRSVLPAVSIHAYSPPLREMTFYEQRTSGPTPTRTVGTNHHSDVA